MMIQCFNTEASVPSGTEGSHVVPDYNEFWIYPGSSTGTSWMLIKYYPDLSKFFLIYWFDDIQITDYDLVPSNIFSLPIPTSIIDKNTLVEKLSGANRNWVLWSRNTHIQNVRGIRQILTMMNEGELTTLCTALVGQYLHETNELPPYFNVIQGVKKQYVNLIVHIEQQTEETCANNESTSRGTVRSEYYNVYLGQSNRNQWKQIGVTKGFRCPVNSGQFRFYVAWGSDLNSVLLIHLRREQHGNEIVKLIENIQLLHLRHLYFNSFVQQNFNL